MAHGGWTAQELCGAFEDSLVSRLLVLTSMRLLLCCAILVTSWCCFGQGISLGVVGGVRTADDIGFPATTESKRYVVGPEVEVGLPFGFGVEVDALYRRDGYSYNFSNFAGSDY